MRLHRLGLTCYGHFEAQDLALDPRPGCINLVVAPNGAGKSVLRHAMAEVLLGINAQTPMGFSFGYPRMRLRVEAELAGERIGFIRRKGDANTVTNLDGRPADAALLGRLPRRDDRKRLERLFMLDSTQLRAGGRELMQTDGDLADALLSGAGELRSARALAEELAKNRDDRAPVRRNARIPFYEACDQWGQAGLALRATVVRPPEIAAREAMRDAAAAARKAANEQAAAARAELARLERIRRSRPLLRALDAAEAWLAGHADAPSLPASAGRALEVARLAAEEAARARQEAAERDGAIRLRLEALGGDDPVLAESEAVDALTPDSGAARGSRNDLPARRKERDDSHRRMAELLRDLGRPADPALAADAIRPGPEITAARALIQTGSAIEAALDGATREVETLRARVAELQAEAAAPAVEGAVDRLRALVAVATADGEPGRLTARASEAAEAARAVLTGELSRVPRWQGDAAALLGLPVPAEAEVTRLAEARRAAQERLARAAKDHSAAVREVARQGDELAALQTGRPIPDEAAVAAARGHRDRGWRLVEARLAGAGVPGEEAAYDDGAPLPLAYARAVAAADAVADRRAEETERVTAAGSLALGIARAAAKQGEEAGVLQAARAVNGAADAAWAGCVGGMGLPREAGLAEARQFLAAREKAVAAAVLVEKAEAAMAGLATRHAEWATALAEVMGQPQAALPLLVSVAVRQVAQADEAAVRRATNAKALQGEARRLAVAEQKLAAAGAKQAAWSESWRAALTGLGRPADEAPASAGAALDALVALAAEASKAAVAEQRIAEMTAQLAAFERQARALAGRLGVPGDDPAALAAALAKRLGEARATQAQRRGLMDQAQEAAAKLQAADSAVLPARDALRRAIQATGAETLEAAAWRVARAAERAEQEGARADALRRLEEAGDGVALEALRAEAARVPPEALAELARAAEAFAAEAEHRAQEKAREAQGIETELTLLGSQEDAAKAALDRQAAAARLGRVLEEAMVQHAAFTLLDHALALVAAESGTNAKLARIGAVFSALTGGAYDRVSPAEEDPESKAHGRLQAHEHGGGIKHIAELSEGTRDQLYLALRIVAIEDHAAGAPPLPFVADDILQTFDDTRTVAALEALLALSAHTQVIVLTHHPHLAVLAEQLPAGSVHLAGL